MYPIVRATVFIVLPVFFYSRPLMPQPVQNMLLAFAVMILPVELCRYFFAGKHFVRWISSLPLLAGILAIFPYRGELEYFDSYHQFIIGGTILLGILYLLESRLRRSDYTQK